MSSIVMQKSIGELIVPKVLTKSQAFTAAGAGDNLAITGTGVDREGMSTGSLALSLDVEVAYDVTLASGATLSLTMNVQDSADNSTFADFATEVATVVATGPSGGARVQGIARLVVPSANKPTGTPGMGLSGARRYIRLVLTPDLSAGGTDTGVVQAIGVFSGFDFLPAPQS